MAQIKIQADVNSDKIEVGLAEIRTYSHQERTMNSLKTLAMFWTLAIVSIFIPVLHFVLVPLLFILGIVLALKKQKASFQMESGKIKCPGCGTSVVLSPSSFQDVHSEICQSCAAVLRVRPIDHSPASH